jgi:hypothetical protein
VFQLFHRYVVSVLCGCCKSRSRCCICCNGCTHILQASVLNASSGFFPRRMLQVCLFGCYIYFVHMLQVFYLDVAMFYNGFQVFLGVFASVSDACFKCFICL